MGHRLWLVLGAVAEEKKVPRGGAFCHHQVVERFRNLLLLQRRASGPGSGTMNISQPVSSAIQAVDFKFLTKDEIQKLSVKRIVSPVTFDSLLHPVPGGLYDPALGAFLDNM